jgi:hypothetical protein
VCTPNAVLIRDEEGVQRSHDPLVMEKADCLCVEECQTTAKSTLLHQLHSFS